MSKQNLVKETKERLYAHQLLESSVLWVGSRDGRFALTWKDFCDKFTNVSYQHLWGEQEIAGDLVVVGSDWWLERTCLDGAEGWAFKRKPSKNPNSVPFDRVKNQDGVSYVREINS